MISSYDVRSRVPSLHDLHAKIRKAAGAPGLASTGTFFILVIGSDARPANRPQATRGDSLHIVGVNPAKGAISILGIPRDSYVPIPGVGTRKINEALLHGPDLMVKTVEQLTGVAIDGYVLTGFAGFQELVNAVGGIRVDVPYAMHDPYSNADFPPGTELMLGRNALAFSRDRHDVPGGDFGRSMNQGRMLIAALRQLKLDVARNPGALLTWVAAGAHVLHTDLGLADIAELLLSMTSLDPGTRREPGGLRERSDGRRAERGPSGCERLRDVPRPRRGRDLQRPPIDARTPAVAEDRPASSRTSFRRSACRPSRCAPRYGPLRSASAGCSTGRCCGAGSPSASRSAR